MNWDNWEMTWGCLQWHSVTLGASPRLQPLSATFNFISYFVASAVLQPLVTKTCFARLLSVKVTDGIFWLKAITVLLVLDMLICKWVSRGAGLSLPVHTSACQCHISSISEVNASQVRSFPKEGHSLDTSWKPFGNLLELSLELSLECPKPFPEFRSCPECGKNGEQWTTVDNSGQQWMWNSCRIWSQRIWIPKAWHSVRLCTEITSALLQHGQHAGQHPAAPRLMWELSTHLINWSSIAMRWNLA